MSEAGPPGDFRMLGRLLRYARPYLAWLAAAFTFSLLYALGRYGRAVITKPLLDDVLLPGQAALAGAVPASEPLARFVELAGWAAAIVLVIPIAIFGKNFLLQYVLGRIHLDIRQQLAAKLLRLPLAFHSDARSGDAVTRILLDVEQSQRGLRVLLLELAEAAVLLVIGVIALVALSWQLTLITLAAAPPIMGVLVYFSRKVRRGSQRRQEQLGEVTQRLLGMLSGIKVIKAFQGEAFETSAFERETGRYFRRALRVSSNRVLAQSLSELLNNGIGIGVLLIGALLVLRGAWGLSVGDITAFVAVVATTYRPVKALSQAWPELAECLSSSERFFALLDAAEEPPDAPDAVVLDGIHRGIRFEGVAFSYGREPVLDDVSLEIRPGEVVAVVGPTGAGKSTLVDLLLRFRSPTRGRITLDGVELERIARRSLLERVAVVTQEPFLFDTSIRENVRYGRPAASNEEVAEACRVAQVDEFLSQLPQGLDTEVGELGGKLSGGQRQRITIARAILRRPDLLIFDEATSALDTRTERGVQAAIERLRGERAVLVIAHRLSTVRGADRIVVLDRGRVSECGSHAELLRAGGLYAQLVALAGEPEAVEVGRSAS